MTDDRTSPASPAVSEGAAHHQDPPICSVVVPFYNEEAAAPRLLGEIQTVLAQLDGRSECLCIDDGSRDGTGAALEAFAARSGSRFRVIRFPRNRGQSAALWRGFREARGDVVITLDGDGQNDPNDIPRLLDQLKTADLVCGIRSNRQDALLRRAMSRLANAVRGLVLRDGMRDSGCGLKAMRREVCSALIPIRTLYSFIPAQAVAAGFRVAQVPVRHRARQGGASSYGFRVFLWRPLVDMLGLLWYRKRCILVPEDCSPPTKGGR